MSALLRRRNQLKSLLYALGVCLGGVIAGFLSALTTPSLYDALVSPGSSSGRLLSLFVVQPGMGLFAAGCILLQEDEGRYVRLCRPTLEGVGWMVLGPAAYWGVTRGVQCAAEAMEWFSPSGHEGEPVWSVLLDNPEVFGIALPVMLAMAFAEELVYRGMVHGVLEKGIGFPGRVVLGALLFGLMHIFLSGGVPSGVLTAAGGLVFAAAYERTGNLLVPVTIHLLIWLRAPV